MNDIEAVEIEQGSAAWHALRAGKVTASRVADVAKRTKSGWSAARGHYRAELVSERLTGLAAEVGGKSAAMRWGNEKEPEAREAYEFYRDASIVTIAFVDHPSIAMAGSSPDGLVGEDGIVEVKCPNAATHLETILSGDVPEEYAYQIQWNLACTGRQWCDFISFDPRMPESMRLFVRRVARDDKTIADLEKIVREFIAEIDEVIVKLRAAYEPEQRAA